MALSLDQPRGDLELAAIAQSLARTRGAAPDWLRAELTIPAPVRRAAPDPNAYRGHMKAALSVGSLFAGFLACAGLVGEVSHAPPTPAPRAPFVDLDGLEAIALVQDWRPAGDDKPVLVRLAGAVRNPAYPRAWSAEKLEEDSYLVIFREPAGAPVYAFEVSLESEAVQATPETVERLTRLRLREEAESAGDLLAHAP